MATPPARAATAECCTEKLDNSKQTCHHTPTSPQHSQTLHHRMHKNTTKHQHQQSGCTHAANGHVHTTHMIHCSSIVGTKVHHAFQQAIVYSCHIHVKPSYILLLGW